MIRDTRTVSDFQHFTFSGHSRKLAGKSLMESIALGHADYACYWSLEMLCSGLVHSLWSTFFESAAIHVHRACPNMMPWLASQYEHFSDIESHFSIGTMTEIRNREDARNLVCETATALATARKQKSIALPTIKPEHDFQPLTMKENLRATTQNASLAYRKTDDPYELAIPYNEYCFAIQTRDTTRALYWVAWMLKYASLKKKQTKETIQCGERLYVEKKYGRNLLWMLWDPLQSTNKYIDALQKIYCLRWDPTSAKSKQPFLLAAIVYATEALDTTESPRRNEAEIATMLTKIPQWIQTIQDTKNTFSSRS